MASGDNEKKKLKCPRKNPCILLRQLVELMEHPISEQTVDRHLLILKQFVNNTHYAYWLHDIPYIIRLYECIVKKLDSFSEFKKPFACLLRFSAVPPMLAKASHRLEYSRDLQEYFSVLGYLILCLHDSNLRILVFDAIDGLLKPKPPVGSCCVSLQYCKEAAEQSRLPEILAQLLQVLSNGLYPFLLNVMFLTCQVSKFACKNQLHEEKGYKMSRLLGQKMLQENAIEYLLQRFEATWHERNMETKPRDPSPNDDIPVFEETCCILWKLLNAIEKEKLDVKNPSVFALWSLRYALRWSVIRHGQRFNRNNLTALVLKMLMAFPAMEVAESDLFDDIVILASMAADCRCYENVELINDGTDYQFKKIIWACVHFLENFRDKCSKKEHELITSLTEILFKKDAVCEGCKEQYCDCVKIALKLIPKLLPCCTVPFIQVNGPAKVIQILQEYLRGGDDLEVLEASMHCLCEMAMMKVDEILYILGEGNASNAITAICNKLMENETLTSAHQKILARGFCILQVLCEAKYVNDKEIITLCTTYLNRVIRPTDSDSFVDVRTTICAVHLLWESILTEKALFDEFLRRGGIYILLDVTEACTFPVKAVTLGVLADASERPASVPYMITWRKRGKRLFPMLMELFRNKTEKVCNEIQNVQLLERENAANQWISLCRRQKIRFQADCISKNELLNNCRNKIHAVVYALKIRFRRQVEVANEHYRLFNEKLNTDDELTMLFAENFFSLKTCEAWTSIARELKAEDITPVSPDDEDLSEKIRMIKQWKFYLQNKIERIFRKDLQKEHLSEMETYTILRDARLSDALEALKDLRFITNCTERMFQMRQKLRLQREVDLALATNYNMHRTMSDLPFTNIFNQTISIQSNITYEKKEDPCPITPVSPCDSRAFTDEDVSAFSLTDDQMEC